LIADNFATQRNGGSDRPAKNPLPVQDKSGYTNILIAGLEPTTSQYKTIPNSDRKATEIGTVLYENYGSSFSVIFSIIFLFDYICYRTPPYGNEVQFISMTSLTIIIHSHSLTMIKRGR